MPVMSDVWWTAKMSLLLQGIRLRWLWLAAIRVMRNYNFLRVLRETFAIVLLCILSVAAHGQSTATTPARVNLTGIVGLVKPARVFLEVEQAGQPPQRLSLREGERDGAIELLSVDAARNR